MSTPHSATQHCNQPRGDDEMVDIGDLKSPGRKAVRVRVPLAPPPSRSTSRATSQQPLSNPEDFINVELTWNWHVAASADCAYAASLWQESSDLLMHLPVPLQSPPGSPMLLPATTRYPSCLPS